MPSSRRAKQDIPVYALYGEADGARVPAGIHAETISSRSSPLGWRIAPHRHSTLHQALLITEGHAVANAEGRRFELAPRSLIWVPPLCVHAYDFAPGTVGIVVSVPQATLAAGLAAAPEALALLSRLSVQPGPVEVDAWETVGFHARALLAAQHAGSPGAQAALQAHATLLALWTAGRAGSGEGAADTQDGPALRAVRRFLASVEAGYAERRTLDDYAADVGVSLSHLDRVCRAVAGRSPARLVQDRRLVEAKRLLTYTAIPVAQIAYRLGFSDAAYFTRFFRQRTGASPLRFRRLADGEGM